jgi:restriction endonuclease Mrr
MPISRPDDFLLHVLKHSAEEAGASAESILEIIPDILELTDADMAYITPGNARTKVANFVLSAFTHLEAAGLVEHVGNGVYCATNRGRNVLALEIEWLVRAFLESFPSYEENLERLRSQRRRRPDQEVPPTASARHADNGVEADPAPMPSWTPSPGPGTGMPIPSAESPEVLDLPSTPEPQPGGPPDTLPKWWPFSPERASKGIIPKQESINAAVLAIMADAVSAKTKTIASKVVDLHRQAKGPNGKSLSRTDLPKLKQRAKNSLAALCKDGLLDRLAIGVYKINETGSRLASERHEEISNAFLRRFHADSGKPATPGNATENATVGVLQPQVPANAPAASDSAAVRLRQAYSRIEETLLWLLKSKIELLDSKPLQDLAVQLAETVNLASADPSMSSKGKWGGRVKGLFDFEAPGEQDVCIHSKPFDLGQAGFADLERMVAEMKRTGVLRGILFAPKGFDTEATDRIGSLSGRVTPVDGNAMVRLMYRHNVGVKPNRTVEIWSAATGNFNEAAADMEG